MIAAYLPTGSWWAIAAATTVFWVAVMLPAAPTRAYRLRYLGLPVLLGALLALRSHGKHFTQQELLSCYALFTFAFPLFVIGRWEEMREYTLDREAQKAGKDVTPTLSRGARVQMYVVTALLVVGTVAILLPG
ncbi:hypothetical protein CFP65_0873 [Kitasatospora sp. MMS16-BH015]|uniref:hypothetical protein n=1 Tax=Kitasatospora sp. MMS16-BH015 TaxID=2018025 RepID=UPI000CA2EA7D|nr:hypothetical protein [Kitasatospora sp. MMS16-BH015]AUG75799.1 hypothetical protein CFP65_0873 [Kitasatospora sp. MMS16-BH015]